MEATTELIGLTQQEIASWIEPKWQQFNQLLKSIDQRDRCLAASLAIAAALRNNFPNQLGPDDITFLEMVARTKYDPQSLTYPHFLPIVANQFFVDGSYQRFDPGNNTPLVKPLTELNDHYQVLSAVRLNWQQMRNEYRGPDQMVANLANALT